MRRTRALTLADQILANASNALFTFLVAGSSTPTAFGRFAVGYAALSFAVAAWRSGLSYQVSMKAGNSTAVHEEASRAVAASLAASWVPALIVLAATGFGAGVDPALAWGMAAATPLVLAQDLLRYSAVAAKRARAAVASDAAWTAFLVFALILRLQGLLTPAWLVALWGSGALIATVILLAALRIVPRFAGVKGWILASWRGRTHLLTGGLAAGASVPITTAIVALVAGPEVVGAVAGAGQLMAPVNSLVAWLSLTLIAHAAAANAQRKTKIFMQAGIASAGLTVLWGTCLLWLPAAVGSVLLGETWGYVVQVLPIVGIQYALSVLAGTGDLFLISAGRTRQVLNNGGLVAAARITFGSVAAATFGTPFAASSAEAVTMAAWLASVVRYLKKGSHRTPEPDPPMSPSGA